MEIVAICDCDHKKLDSASKAMPALEGKKLATYENPKSYPEGIPFVVVNGRLIKDQD